MKYKYCALGCIYIKDNPTHFQLAIESILNQTISIPICLIINGPLNQEQEDLLKNYKKKIKYLIRLKMNVGLGLALNQGLEILKRKYQYTIRFDSDDINLPIRFEELITKIELHEPDLIGSYMYECSGKDLNVINQIRSVPLIHNKIKSLSIYRNPFNHPTVAYRIQSVIDVGCYDKLKYMEDWLLWIQLINKGYKVMNIEKCLVKFRFDEAMLDRRRGILYAKSEYFFFKKISKLTKEKKIKLFIIMTFRIFLRFLPLKLFKHLYLIVRQTTSKK